MSIHTIKPSLIPPLGLGTWRLKGKDCESIVRMALELGYRHIDTADVYQNHGAIGEAIQGFPREKLFITSKLFMEDLTPRRVKKAAARFLKELKIDYLDLLLIHWPNPEAALDQTLQSMLDLREEGLIRSIGVSNFVRFHLESLAAHHFPILTNQIEVHPYLQRRVLRQACQRFGIKVTAYRPLAQGAFEQDPVLRAIGGKYGKTPSQVALRWIIQNDMIAIPKASTLEHLKQNQDVFDFSLSSEDLEQILKLDKGQRFCQPSDLPVYDD